MTKRMRVAKIQKERANTLKRKLKNENVDTIEINDATNAGRLTGRASAERVFAEQMRRKELSKQKDDRTSKDFI